MELMLKSKLDLRLRITVRFKVVFEIENRNWIQYQMFWSTCGNIVEIGVEVKVSSVKSKSN